MKHPFLVLILAMFATFSLKAQNSIEGAITLENGIAATNVRIALHHNSNSTLSKEWEVDESGYVVMEDIADGDYHLVVTKENYEPILIENFRFPKDNDSVFGLMMKELKPINLIASEDSSRDSNHVCKNFH